jgi:hypothetical protein
MIGYIDVQTSPVYFHAQRSSGYPILKTVIPFDLLRLNLGNTMNTSGIFVARPFDFKDSNYLWQKKQQLDFLINFTD